MQSFQSSGRRTGDVEEAASKTPYQGQGNRQLLHSNNSSDQESHQLRMWASCEEDRPNNWVGDLSPLTHSIAHHPSLPLAYSSYTMKQSVYVFVQTLFVCLSVAYKACEPLNTDLSQLQHYIFSDE